MRTRDSIELDLVHQTISGEALAATPRRISISVVRSVKDTFRPVQPGSDPLVEERLRDRLPDGTDFASLASSGQGPPGARKTLRIVAPLGTFKRTAEDLLNATDRRMATVPGSV